MNVFEILSMLNVQSCKRKSIFISLALNSSGKQKNYTLIKIDFETLTTQKIDIIIIGSENQ